jgi:hypothetical protein
VSFKKSVFGNHHVIKMDTHKDNITGLCNGMGKVQVRCTDSESQKAEIIGRLNQKGVSAKVRSQTKGTHSPAPEAVVERTKSQMRNTLVRMEGEQEYTPIVSEVFEGLPSYRESCEPTFKETVKRMKTMITRTPTKGEEPMRFDQTKTFDSTGFASTNLRDKENSAYSPNCHSRGNLDH